MRSLSWIRKIVALVFGLTLLLIGVALLVLPGPGILVGGIGLAILATEFWWARWLINRAKTYSYQVVDGAKYQYDRFRGVEPPSSE